MVFENRTDKGGLPDTAIQQGVISPGGGYGGTGSVSRSGVKLVQQAVGRLLAALGVKGALPDDLETPQRTFMHRNQACSTRLPIWATR